MDNTTLTMKRGEVGVVFNITLKANGSAVDLTGKTVTLTARKNLNTDAVIDDYSCTVSSGGIITFTPDSTAANVAKGEYLLEFKVTGSGRTDYFPKNADGTRTYGKFIVQESL